MDINAANISELRTAISQANTNPAEQVVIHLTGTDEDYVVKDAVADLFGPTAFPIITGRVVIEGNGSIIARDFTAPFFRFFGVDANHGAPKAELVLKTLILSGGISDMGGGAVVNDGTFIAEGCVFGGNQGTHGGAVYAGDTHNTTLIDCVFGQNAATVKGDAVFGALSCALHMESCRFRDISANSVELTGKDNLIIKDCSVWDGAAFQPMPDIVTEYFTDFTELGPFKTGQQLAIQVDMNAANISELRTAISQANAKPGEQFIIHLTGNDADYVVSDAVDGLFGSTAFPVVTGRVLIEGRGKVIERHPEASFFRFFGIDANHSAPQAELVLKNLTLVGGNSDTDGGGAVVNDGLFIAQDCEFRENQGERGGAIYAGDNHNTTLMNCIFIKNTGTLAGGGAVSGASTSILHIESCLFSENSASSIMLAGQHNATIKNCAVWDGNAFQPISDTNELYLSDSAQPPNGKWFTTGQQPVIERLPFQRSRLGWGGRLEERDFLQMRAVPEVNRLLTGLNMTDQISAPRVSVAIEKGASSSLIRLAEALQALADTTEWARNALRDLIQSLALTPNREALNLVFKLAVIQTQRPFDSIASYIINGQPAEYVLDLYEHVTEYKNPLQLDILSSLIAELGIQGVNGSDNPAIQKFVESEKQRGGQSANLLWLPLVLTDIENNLQPKEAFYSWENLLLHVNTNFDGSHPANQPFPVYTEEKIPFEDRWRINSAAMRLEGEGEIRRFRFESPLDPAVVTPQLLQKLNLGNLVNIAVTGCAAMKVEEVMTVLYSIAYHGGVYPPPLSPAYSRLAAWNTIAGLMNTDKHAAWQDVLAQAKSSHWFSFAINDYSMLMTMAVGALTSDNHLFTVVAASATD